MEHGKKAWRVSDDGNAILFDSFTTRPGMEPGIIHNYVKVYDKDIARRIVACVNALASFTTEQIEQGIDLVNLLRQHEKLVNDYHARGMALVATEAMQAGETERADKAEAQRDQLAEALGILYHSLPDLLPLGSAERFINTGEWQVKYPATGKGTQSNLTVRTDDLYQLYDAMDATYAALAAVKGE